MGSFSDPPEIYGADYKTDDGRNTIAWYRLRHRFADATSEVERSGIFIECMSRHEEDGVYWANWDFVIENTKLFVL
jgi:hypothetical protein